MPKKEQTSITLTPEARRLSDAIAEKLGITRSAVFEIAIRRLADLEGVECTPDGKLQS